VLYYIWELAFSYFDRPQAAALTVIVLLVLGIVATVKFTFLDRRTHYQ
jgi:sn-glycerol 3-phosphate transport system permease protein